MDVHWWRSAMRWLIPVFLSAMLLGACTVPEHMQVRAGIDPRNQDDQVRFRSTYYFRVFDVCRNPDNGRVEVNGPPKSDSLYRFRMTGKASSLLSQVHFESGTLHKSEIDPFGSNVVFDENLSRYRVVSAEETEAAARRNERYKEIERRLNLFKDLNNAKKNGFTKSDQKLDEGIKMLLDSIKNQIVNLDPPTTGLRSNAAGCPPGSELTRGFQIVGPEGISTFTQDQRLVMAMTSRGKPLISALKGLSGRMHGSGSEFLLSLTQEHIAILRAKHVVDKFTDETSVTSAQLIERVIKAFNQDAPQGAPY